MILGSIRFQHGVRAHIRKVKCLNFAKNNLLSNVLKTSVPLCYLPPTCEGAPSEKKGVGGGCWCVYAKDPMVS